MLPRLLVAAVVTVVLVLRPALVRDLEHSRRAWAVSAGIVVASAIARRLVARRSTTAAPWVAAAVTLGLFTVVAAPAFRERTLHEEFPAVAAPVADEVAQETVAAPRTAAPVVRSPSPTAKPTPTATLLSAGQLDGLGGHHASGRVALYRVGQDVVLRFEDVDITGGAKPSVHLVPPGQERPEGGRRLGALKAEHGSFSYPVPSTTDLTWSVLVWCDPYAVPIGAADLH